MTYNISNSFFVRTTFGSIDEYLKFLEIENYSEKILNVYYSNLELQEIIQTSSYSLFRSIMDNSGDKEQIKSSLLNYFSRMCTRTTPFAFLAGVSLGKFGLSKEINKIAFKKSTRVDMEWLGNIIMRLEKKNWAALVVVWNQSTSQISNKFLNDWNTFFMHGLGNRNTLGTKTYINYTKAVQKVKNSSRTPVSIIQIKGELQELYPETSINVLDAFLKELFDKEFLISNLRGNPLVGNHLEYVLSVIEENKYYADFNLNSSLKKLDFLIKKFNQTKLGEGVELFDNAIDVMRDLYETKNYLRSDLYSEDTVTLNTSEKEKLLELINFLSSNSDENNLSYMNRWRDRFQERFSETEQLLESVIDYSHGIGLPVSNSTIDNRHILYDESIENELMYNIQIMQKRDYIDLADFVTLKRKDSSKIPIDNDEVELAMFVQKSGENLKFSLSPLIGTNSVGSTIGRFLYCLDQDGKFLDKLSLYDEDSGYDEVEVIYYPQIDRITNILNTKSKRRYIMEFGTYTELEEGVEKISLSDIIINADNHGVYFKHRITKRRLIFFSNHATRVDFAPPLAKFLIESRKFNRPNVLSLLTKIKAMTNKYAIVPRIMYKDIMIQEKMWRLNTVEFDNLLESEFSVKFLSFAETVGMDQFVFLQEYDNRVLIDIQNPIFQNLIYRTFKKNKNIMFLENTFDKEQIIINEKKQPMIAECIFYFKQEISTYSNKLSNRTFQEVSLLNEVIMPFENYIYLKVYMHPFLEEEFILKILYPFCKLNLKNNNITSFFFMRYYDEKSHIRIRFKMSDHNTEFQTPLNEFIIKLKKEGISQNISIDTYIPEIKRYGGQLVFERIENLFFLNSLVVIQTLNLLKSNHDEVEKDLYGVYIICNLVLGTGMGWSEADKLSEKMGNRKGYNKEFREKKSDYMDLLLSDENKVSQLINKISEKQIRHLEQLWIDIEYNEKQSTLANDKENIILSLIHMFCNRFYGTDRDKELFVQSIAAKTIHNVYSYKKNFNEEK